MLKLIIPVFKAVLALIILLRLLDIHNVYRHTALKFCKTFLLLLLLFIYAYLKVYNDKWHLRFPYDHLERQGTAIFIQTFQFFFFFFLKG